MIGNGDLRKPSFKGGTCHIVNARASVGKNGVHMKVARRIYLHLAPLFKVISIYKRYSTITENSLT
jgi:hypothetical protein